MKQETIITFDNVHYTYPEETAETLCGITMQVKRGSFVAVLGINGSGKSSLAKHMNAILTPNEGKVTVYGMDTADEEGTQFKMTYQPTNSEVVLSFIDPDTVESDDSLVYYAGFDEDGVQWTVGFDFDNSAIAVNVSKDDQDITMAGVFEDNGTDTLTVTWEDGTVEELGYEFLDEDGRTLKLTSDDVSFVVSYIDSSVFDDLAA
jgi:energy-coupling factor transporter ATP-binding protein EcfA2